MGDFDSRMGRTVATSVGRPCMRAGCRGWSKAWVGWSKWDGRNFSQRAEDYGEKQKDVFFFFFLRLPHLRVSCITTSPAFHHRGSPLPIERCPTRTATVNAEAALDRIHGDFTGDSCWFPESDDTHSWQHTWAYCMFANRLDQPRVTSVCVTAAYYIYFWFQRGPGNNYKRLYKKWSRFITHYMIYVRKTFQYILHP